MYKHLIQKERMNNCIPQFLKNETKIFLALQNIFYSLLMKVSIHCQKVNGGVQNVSINFLSFRFIIPQISSLVLIKTYAELIYLKHE